jgi:hypothetical protein
MGLRRDSDELADDDLESDIVVVRYCWLDSSFEEVDF